MLGSLSVVNYHHIKGEKQEPENTITRYIGRGSPLGNKFPMDPLTRDEVITLFRADLSEHLKRETKSKITDELNLIANLLLKGVNVRMSCFCAPKRCHGDVLKDLIERTIANA